MTTRDDARRRGEARTAATRAVVGAAPVENLPERLLAARERKGVDLYRAERDTKIRARYLGALERGEYRELPGSVYTKGFLRNYALYLGLDPDEVLVQWRRETREGTAKPEPVIVVPRPLTAPRQGLTFSPAIVVAALMTLVLIAFGTYLAVQVLRFQKPPTIAVTEPSTAVSDVDDSATTFLLQGTTIPHGTVNVADATNHTTQVTAGADGSWSQSVPLRRGRNDFRVSALDPETGRPSDQTVAIIINVPFSVILAPTLAVDSPADNSSFQNGAIPVSGTATNAAQVVVSAAFLGPASQAVSASPSPGAKATPTPAPTPVAPAPVTLPVGSDGAFTTPFELTTGRWEITVAASSTEGRTSTITRTVTVAYKGVNLVVTIKGRAWLKVWVDGVLDPSTGAAGKVFGDGKVLTYTGKGSVEVRTGSSGSTYFTLNGTSLGRLGAAANPETWLFSPTGAPKQTSHQ